LEKFKDVDHNKIAKLLFENGQGELVAKNLEKLKDVDHNEIAKLLIENGQGELVARNLEKFNGLTEKIAKLLIINSLKLSPPRETASRSATHEFPNTL
jgi:precorrin-6B methylase 1